MSAPAANRRAPRKPLPSAWNVIVATLGLFLVILTLLALQVRSGKRSVAVPGRDSGRRDGFVQRDVAAGATRQVVTKTS